MQTISLHVAGFFCCYHVIDNIVINIEVTGDGLGNTRQLLRYFKNAGYDAVCFHNGTGRARAYEVLCRLLKADIRNDGQRDYYAVNLHSEAVDKMLTSYKGVTE
jgi:hypothetical protein